MAYVRSKMRTRGMTGKKHKGPLREVREVKYYAQSLFEMDSVVFVCGHDGRRSMGARRGRGSCMKRAERDSLLRDTVNKPFTVVCGGCKGVAMACPFPAPHGMVYCQKCSGPHPLYERLLDVTVKAGL